MTVFLTIAASAIIGAALRFPLMQLKAVMLKKRGIESTDTKVEKYVLPAIMAVAAGLVAWRTGLTWRLAYMVAMLADCALIAVIDAKHRIIPNELILVLMALTGVAGLLGIVELDILSSLAGFAVCFVLFLLPCLFAKKIGAGDVKLAAAMGFCAGLIGSMYAVAMMGALVLVYTFVERRLPLVQSMKTLIPMGPFIAISLMIVQAL